MTVSELVAHIAAHGASLTVEGEKLRVCGPQRAITPEVLATLRQHKAEFIAYLTRWRGKSIAALLAHLAAHGVWIDLDRARCPRFRVLHKVDLEEVEEVVIDELHHQVNELIEFLRRRAEEMTTVELEALGFSPAVRDSSWPFDGGWYMAPRPPVEPEDATGAAE